MHGFIRNRLSGMIIEQKKCLPKTGMIMTPLEGGHCISGLQVDLY